MAMTNPVDDLRARIATALCVDHGHAKQDGGLNCATCARRADVVMAEVEPVLARQRSWQGLVALLDEHYPAEVFDGSSDEPGPRIVALVRALDRAEASRRDWAAEAMRLDELLRQAAEALCAVGKKAIAVKPTLDKPYPDAPQWTPWTRFLGPAVSNAYNLGVEIRKQRRASADVEDEPGAAVEGGA